MHRLAILLTGHDKKGEVCQSWEIKRQQQGTTINRLHLSTQTSNPQPPKRGVLQILSSHMQSRAKFKKGGSIEFPSLKNYTV